MANIITTLQPNINGTYNSGALVGAATKVAAMIDNSDYSYIQIAASSGVFDQTFYNETFAPSNPLKVVIDNFKIITRRQAHSSGQGGQYTYTLIRVNTTNYLYSLQGPCGGYVTLLATNFTTTLTLNPLTGLPWTIADINNTQIGARIAVPVSSSGQAMITKAYCQVEYHYKKSSRSCVLIRKK